MKFGLEGNINCVVTLSKQAINVVQSNLKCLELDFQKEPFLSFDDSNVFEKLQNLEHLSLVFFNKSIDAKIFNHLVNLKHLSLITFASIFNLV